VSSFLVIIYSYFWGPKVGLFLGIGFNRVLKWILGVILEPFFGCFGYYALSIGRNLEIPPIYIVPPKHGGLDEAIEGLR